MIRKRFFAAALLFVLRSASADVVIDKTGPNKPQATPEVARRISAKLLENYGKSEVRFEQNVGQAQPGIGFIGRGLHHSLALKSSGAVLTQPGDKQAGQALELLLENSRSQAAGSGIRQLPGKTSYLIGSDQSKWLHDIPAFEKVSYSEVWPGVDVVYYGNQSQLEYDFIVHPGSDPGAVRLRFPGARDLSLNQAGDLLIHTGAGDLLQRRPRVYQNRDGKNVDLASQYVLRPDQSIAIEVAGYDKASDLIIDPILVYGKILDGRFTMGNAVTIDSSGNGYYVGESYIQISAGFFQYEAYLVKLDPAGNQLLSTTFGGSNGPTVANAVAVDSSGNIYVTGATSASDFALGGFQPALSESAPNHATDAFLIKFNPNFATPYVSYIGGHGNDSGNAIVVDNAGNAYVAGSTSSPDFPVTEGQAYRASGSTGFVIKINTTIQAGTSSRVWATYLGGTGTDVANGVAVDGSGNVTVGGTTTSADFAPATGTGFSPTKTNGANVDGFIVTLNSAGSAANYFTYLAYGRIGAISGNSALIYATGQTDGNIYTTPSAYQASGGTGHAFVTKFNTSVGGTGSVPYSTYLGGAGLEAGLGIASDSAGDAYVTGTTTSNNFPTTSGGIPLPSGSAPPDAFLSVLNTNASGSNALTFSTLLGGSANDLGNGVAVDNFGNMLVTGTTFSPNFIGLSTGITNANQSLAFAAKFGGETVTPTSGSGSNQVFTFNYTDVNGFLDISGSQIVINSTLSAGQSCYILFGRGSNQISLASDNGASFSSATIGAPVVLQNSQCSVIAFLTNQVGSGNNLTLNLSVVFKPGFAGPKTVFTKVDTNGGQSSGYQALGTYTATVGSQAIQVVSVTPSTGTGSAQPFTFTYSDPNGYPDLSGSQVVINSSLTAGNGCYLLFGRGNNLISLADDSGQNFTSAVLGAQTILQNSQCILFVGNSYQTGNGLNLSLTLYLAFKSNFGGTRTIFSKVDDNAGNTSGYKQLGSYTVATAGGITLVSATPSGGSGISGAFTYTAYDPAGFQDISQISGVFNSSLSAAGGCYVVLSRAGNTVSLFDDSGSTVTTAPLGASGILQNSQCIVNAAASSQFGSGNVLSFTPYITFKPGFAGAKTMFAKADTNGGASTNFQNVGTFTVVNPTSFGTLSVTPSAGQGTTQAFTFVLSDPNGFNDISGGQMVYNPSLVAPGSCYFLFGRPTNLITLADNTGGNFNTSTLGANNVLTNSQCSIDASKSFQYGAGNVTVLTVFITFNPSYAGLKYAFSKVDNNSANTSGYQVVGSFQSP